MNYNIAFTFLTEKDIEEIVEWYGSLNKEVSNNFINELGHTFNLIEENPYLFQQVHKTFRQASIVNFPYIITYRIENTNIIVLAVTHQKRNPKVWKKRK